MTLIIQLIDDLKIFHIDAKKLKQQADNIIILVPSWETKYDRRLKKIHAEFTKFKASKDSANILNHVFHPDETPVITSTPQNINKNKPNK